MRQDTTKSISTLLCLFISPSLRLFLLTAAVLCAACERTSPTPSHSAEDLRIVSLSPAISRTLVDFDLDDRIVGRTQFCASIDQSIPVVGSLLEVDYERLITLEPTHVLVQPSVARGVEPKLLGLAETHGWTIGEFPALNTVDDIEDMIRSLPALLFADESEARTQASARAAALVNDMAKALRPAGEEAWIGSTLLVVGVEPVYIFGRDTYLSDLLSALGGTNAAHLSGWAEVSLEDVIRLNPEAIVLVRETPPDDLKRALGPLGSLPVRAVENNRLAALVHPDANLPSSGVIGVTQALRALLVELKHAEVDE